MRENFNKEPVKRPPTLPPSPAQKRKECGDLFERILIVFNQACQPNLIFTNGEIIDEDIKARGGFFRWTLAMLNRRFPYERTKGCGIWVWEGLPEVIPCTDHYAYKNGLLRKPTKDEMMKFIHGRNPWAS